MTQSLITMYTTNSCTVGLLKCNIVSLKSFKLKFSTNYRMDDKHFTGDRIEVFENAINIKLSNEFDKKR